MTAQIGRFVVRDLSPWDGDKIFAMTGDAEAMKYMGIRTHKSIDEATALLKTYQNSPTNWQAICTADDPASILGVVGIEVRGHQTALTIMFRRGWKARGAGREFLVPFVQWIFTHPNIWRVWAVCHVDNVPIQRVMQRMGAECEGRLRRFDYFPNISDEPQDVYAYAITRG